MNVRDFFDNLSKKEIIENNKKQIEQADVDFKRFKENTLNNICDFCYDSLHDFNPNKPCLHWMLRPKNIKKKDYNKLFYADLGYFRLSSYLKWLANTLSPIGKINNLLDEKSDSKKIETTIQYKNILWSLSCSNTDFSGHANKRTGKYHHFHLDMRIDNKSFIKFNDFHIPFNQEDMFTFEAIEKAPDKFKYFEYYGSGIQDLFNEISAGELLDNMKATDDYKNAPYRMQTIITAPKGKTISGDELANLYKERQKTGLPIAKLAQKLKAGVTTIISPGEGVPKLKKRNPRKTK